MRPSRPVIRPRRRSVSAGALLGLVVRPELWTSAARTGLRLAAPGWWRRWPPSPRPPQTYEAFRHQTMFGATSGAELTAEQLVGYLEWCRAMRRLR